jgi:GWxTD domain-containing protein
MPLIVSIWAVGIFFFAGAWMLRLRRTRFSVEVPCETVYAGLIKAKQQLSLRSDVRLAISKDAAEPILKGIWRPVIVLPKSLAQSLTASELNAVLLHELSHVKRRDNLTATLAHLVSIAFWFFPLLWWMERQLSIDCEYACDEIVLSAARTPAEYASGMLKATRFALFGAVAGISGIRGFEFKKRLELIMSQTDDFAAKRASRGLISAAIAAVVLIPLVGGFASRGILQAQTLQKRHGVEFITASASDNTPQAQQLLSELKTLLNPNQTVLPVNGNGPWDKWLNQEVAFLITPEERSAFLALKSDEQRRQFVDQFWAKRNPTPGSDLNAFKQEHYRRIAYANDRFAAVDAAGWQTDRGRTYILLGPPDEIDSHPDQNREMWRYRIGITIEFDTSDRSRS